MTRKQADFLQNIRFFCVTWLTANALKQFQKTDAINRTVKTRAGELESESKSQSWGILGASGVGVGKNWPIPTTQKPYIVSLSKQ